MDKLGWTELIPHYPFEKEAILCTLIIWVYVCPSSMSLKFSFP